MAIQGPIDYSIGYIDPVKSGFEGFQVGSEILKLRQQREAEQRALQAQELMRQELIKLAENPTPQAVQRIAALNPAQAEQWKKLHDMFQSEQARGERVAARQAFYAIQSGRPEAAAAAWQARADQLRAAKAPQADIDEAQFMADDLRSNPAEAAKRAQLMMSIVDKDFVENFAKAGQERRAEELQPSAVRKGEAEAKVKETEAKFAEPQAILDIQKKGWDIESIKADINYKREANRIAAMNAAANREGNELKREELRLKVQEARSALEEKARTKIADVESATSTIDNLINTVDRIKNNPSLNDVVGSIEGRLPAVVSDEASDAIALIETLGSQVFMSQIPAMKGTGALSEKEGDKLQTSLQNLGRAQSEKQFRANLDEVQRLMLKARKNVQTRYGVKAAPPDTPAVQTSPGDIDALVKKYGGQ